MPMRRSKHAGVVCTTPSWPAIYALVFGALASCSNDAERAQERHEMVVRHGTLAEACSAARAVAEAHLQARNEQEYQVWTNRAAITCSSAALSGGHLPADESTRRNVLDAVERDMLNAENQALAADRAALDAENESEAALLNEIRASTAE